MKNKVFIGINLIVLLLIILGILAMNTETRAEGAKEKLQQVINESYTEDRLDINELKNNIEKDIDNSRVLNKNTQKFPVHTVVDGYEFKVEENGNIKTEENVNENNNNEQVNNVQNEEETKDDKETPKKVETIVKYQDDEKEGNGITISTTKEGIVTINGKSTDKLFIKISNNIQISNNAKSFEKWQEEDGIIIEKGKQIKQKVTIINNKATGGQVNAVLRTEKNEATAILKLVNEETGFKGILEENIIANYIYIDKDVVLDNMKFKVEITEEIINNILELKEDTKTDKGIECIIDKDGKIKLNGTAEERLFIKITNGIHTTSNGNENTKLAETEPILFSKDNKINVIVKEIQGNCITTNSNQEFNFVLKYQDGNIALNYKTREKILSKELTLEKDITIAYLFVSEGVAFEDYIIEPIIY